jgi:two-component system NarL family sensor kinase
MKNEFQQSTDVSNWLDKLRADINEIIENTRRISRNLSPVIIDDLGLDAALENIVQSFSKACGISCSYKPQSLKGLHSVDGKRLVYRLVQETLTNIGKHAHATHIEFTIAVEDNLVEIKISDNGKGFAVHSLDRQIPGHQGIGMTAMVHRANMLGGSTKIDSTIGRGTTVYFTFPLNAGLL